MQDGDAIRHELEGVAVRRGHERGPAGRLLGAGSCGEEVVRFVPRLLGRGEADRADEGREHVELLEQLTIEDATALVRRERRVPVRGDVERVPRDEHRARPLVLPQPQEHVREADERVAGAAVRSAHRLRERVVRAMRERVAVDDEKRRAHDDLPLQLVHRVRQAVGGDARRLVRRKPAEIVHVDGSTVGDP